MPIVFIQNQSLDFGITPERISQEEKPKALIPTNCKNWDAVTMVVYCIRDTKTLADFRSYMKKHYQPFHMDSVYMLLPTSVGSIEQLQKELKAVGVYPLAPEQWVLATIYSLEEWFAPKPEPKGLVSIASKSFLRFR